MPERTRKIFPGFSYSAEEYERIRNGFRPTVMEDKWFIFWESDVLYFHRSWTGWCAYKVAFTKDGDSMKTGEVEVNGDTSQYSGMEDDYEASVLGYLIDILLLGRKREPPQPAGMEKEQAALFLWSVMGRASLDGYRNEEVRDTGVKRPPSPDRGPDDAGLEDVMWALFDRKIIDARESPQFLRPAPPLSRSRETLKDRVRGMLVGLAIGDSLGNTSELMLPAQRAALYGEVRDYLPNRHAGGKRIGLPSDDTQLSFITLREILRNGRIAPDKLTEAFAAERIIGIGSTVKDFIRVLKSGVPWYRAGRASAGNGALMRVPPLLLPALRDGGTGFWADLVVGSMITHNDSASIASCVAFGTILRELMEMDRTPLREWWVARFTEVAAEVETERVYGFRGGPFNDCSGTISECVNLLVPEALRRGMEAAAACGRWYSGAYLFETVPSVLFILSKYGNDPEEAIARAVNDTWDNDTAASVVGAAIGALHGFSALPKRWAKGRSGRYTTATAESLFQLADQAEARFI